MHRVEKIHPRSWFVIFCGAIFYCYQFIIRVSPGIMTDEIMHTLSIDASSFGFIIGFFYWAYALMQIPLGVTMDKFGPRLLISGAGFIIGIACFLFSSTSSVYFASMARFMMGVGAACGFLGTLKLGTIWMPPRHLGKVISFTLVLGTTGAGLGGTPLRYLMEQVGWVTTYHILGIVGVILGSLSFIIIRNGPEAGPSHHIKASGNQELLKGIIQVLTSPQCWIISGVGLMMYVPLATIGDAWGVYFLENAYHFDEKIAATVILAMFIGAMIGSPFFTALSDRLMSRRTPMFIGVTGSLIVYMFIVFAHDLNLWTLYALFFAAGFCYTSKALCFASICEIMPRQISGITIGFTNMVVMTSGIMFHPLIGKMLHYHWDGTTQANGGPDYNAGDFQFALTVLPLCLGLALIFVGVMKETHPGSQKRNRYRGK